MGSLLNACLIAIASTNFVATTTTHALAWSNSSWRCRRNNTARRKWISESISLIVSFPATTASSLVIQHPTSSHAEEYDNPNYPAPPEERCETSFISSFFSSCCVQGSLAAYDKWQNCISSVLFLYPYKTDLYKTAGLVVLRVAEVAQFQEKILRAILNGDLTGVVVTPQQMWVSLSMCDKYNIHAIISLF